ncbi:MAG TPA: hypothetical protein VGK53_15845 [Propionicimonas sp.]
MLTRPGPQSPNATPRSSPPEGHCAAGLDAEKATDILVTLYGDRTYIQMTIEHAWGQDQYIEWMCDAAPRLLLDLDKRT